MIEELKENFKHIEGMWPQTAKMTDGKGNEVKDRMKCWQTALVVKRKIFVPSSRLIHCQKSVDGMFTEHQKYEEFLKKFRSKPKKKISGSPHTTVKDTATKDGRRGSTQSPMHSARKGPNSKMSDKSLRQRSGTPSSIERISRQGFQSFKSLQQDLNNQDQQDTKSKMAATAAVDMTKVKFIIGSPDLPSTKLVAESSPPKARSPEPVMKPVTAPSNSAGGRMAMKPMFQLDKAALKNPHILAKSRLPQNVVKANSNEPVNE